MPMPTVVFSDGVRTVTAKSLDERLAAQVVNDADILLRPDPAHVVEGRIVEDTLVMLFGAAGIGKTFVAGGLALSIASGRPWLGAAVRTKGPVIYGTGEGSAGFKARLKAGKLALGIPLAEVAGVFILPQGIDLMSAETVDAFLKAFAGMCPRAVVFDTLARNMIGDDNSAADISRVVASLDRIGRETGAVRIILHHATKAGGVERGSSAIRGACDTVLSLTQTDDLLTLSCEKQKDSEPFAPIPLRLVPVPESGSCVMRLASEVLSNDELSPMQDRVFRVFTDLFMDGAPAKDWQQACLSQGVPEATFFRAIKVLATRGLVVKRGRDYVRGAALI